MSAEQLRMDQIQADGMDEAEDGFYWKSHGRAAIIYFVEHSLVLPIDVEMPGVDHLDALIYGETKYLGKRYDLTHKVSHSIDPEDRMRIQQLLIAWLALKGIRHDIAEGS